MNLLSLLLVAALCVLCCASTGRRCSDNSRACTSSTECCSSCCAQGQCATNERCTASTQGACALHNCPPDKECYLQKVQCITAPCPPIPACRPRNSDDYDYD